MLVAFGSSVCYGDTSNKTNDKTNDIKVVYNTKNLDFGEKSVVNVDGSVYIPIRALSEQLHFTVDWDSTKNTARIHDNLNDVYLGTNGDVNINGVKSKSDKVPLNSNGSIYVPLRFVSEALGVDVNYDSKTRIVNMTGRDIYEISQQDISKPYLIAYTKEGRKQVTLIDERNGDVPTWLISVERTKYSDIVNTAYVHSGALSITYENQIYVKNGTLIDNGNRIPNGRDIYTLKPNGVQYYDDRVALLSVDSSDNATIKIYDDKTGKVLKTLNTEEFYADEFNSVFPLDENGTTVNIQAVGEDFIVVNMQQPNVNAKTESEHYLSAYFYTTVINLNTLEYIPVYTYFDNYKLDIVDAEMSRALTYSYNMTGEDGIFFEKINEDGTLSFAITEESIDGVNWNGERCSVKYK